MNAFIKGSCSIMKKWLNLKALMAKTKIWIKVRKYLVSHLTGTRNYSRNDFLPDQDVQSRKWQYLCHISLSLCISINFKEQNALLYLPCCLSVWVVRTGHKLKMEQLKYENVFKKLFYFKMTIILKDRLFKETFMVHFWKNN